LLWNGGYTQNNQFNLKSNYRELIHETLDYFTEMEDVQVHLIGHVLTAKKDSVEDDYRICELMQKKYSKAIVAPWFNSPIEAKNYISGLDFFTGARMHACIAAFSSGVPVFPMAYSRKFNGLFAETLHYEWMGDCVTETNAMVLNNMKDSFVKRSSLKGQIFKANETIVKPRLELLKSILSDIIKTDNVG
jgi:colanic acid/amylovoran biosynthesis protein